MPAAKATKGRTRNAQDVRNQHIQDMAQELRLAMTVIEELIWLVPGEKGEDMRRKFYGK